MPPIEVIEKRTRNSKTHSLGGRRYAFDGTIGSIHYEENGWQEIDNYFEPALAPWDWQMLKAGYHIRVKENFTAGQIIEFEKQGEAVQLQPMALEWTNDLDQIQQISMPQNVSPIITNPVVDLLPAVGVPSHMGTIRWHNAYGSGIDFEWKCTPSRLNKILEVANLSDLPVPQQYVIDGGNPVLKLNLIFDPPRKQDVDIVVDSQVWNQQSDIQTFNIIEFVKDGEVLWGFMPLRYWGSYVGEDEALEKANEGQSIATLEKKGNKLYISIRIPYDWLQSAVFPILIDTDVNESVGAELDNAYEKDDTSSFRTDTFIAIYRHTEGISTRMHGGFRFQTVAVPNGAIINANTYLSLYFYDAVRNDLYCTIYGNDVDDAVDFSDDANIKTRGKTDANIAWQVENITTGQYNNSDGISTIIKEIVDRVGWATGQDMCIVCIADIGTTKSCRVHGYGSDPSKTALLHIEYTVGGVTHEGAATLSGVGTLAAIGQGILIGKSTLSGAGTLATIGRRIVSGKAALSGVGTLAGIGSFLRFGKATLSGQGSLSVIGRRVYQGAVTLAGQGTLASIGRLIAVGKVTLSGVGTLSAIGQRICYGIASLTGAGTLVANGVLTAIGKATLAGTGTLVAIGRRIFIGKATLEGTGTLAGIGRLIATGKATLSGVGTLTVIVSVVARLLKIAIITSQYRQLNTVTSQYRLIKSVTAQYRKIKAITAQNRLLKIIKAQYRKAKSFTSGG